MNENLTNEEVRIKILNIFKKHNIDLFHVPVLFEDGETPYYFVAQKSIVLTYNLTPERYAFQVSHEYVHAYFDSPWIKESDTDWREEFIATLISLTICKELGSEYLAYALRSFKTTFISVAHAAPVFWIKTRNEYLVHPSHVYNDDVCMPLLYFIESNGKNAWSELDTVKEYLSFHKAL